MEMEKFLASYGLKWVGNDVEGGQGKLEGKFNAEQVKKDIDNGKDLYKVDLPMEIDIQIIAKRIAELNFEMGKSLVMLRV